MLKELLKNTYIRVSIVIIAGAALAGLMQAYIEDALVLILLMGLSLGGFLIVFYIIKSVFSVVLGKNISLKKFIVPQEKQELYTYKKRFIRYLTIALPGYAIMISAAYTYNINGNGEAGFVFVFFFPLFFVSIIFTLPMIYYGIAYLYKKKK